MKDKITAVLFKFANSFDLKDWQGLESTLADTITCDYQDLRATSGYVTKHEYVDLRKTALAHLKTQHLFANLEISQHKEHADCRLNAMIYRQNDKGVAFNSHVMYDFSLLFVKDAWKISKIKQTVL